MKKMKDYHNLYLKCDVLLLVNFFEKFRNNSLKNYELCPSHYLSAPGLSWDAMLRMTKIKIDLVLDSEMYILFEVQEEEFLILVIDTTRRTINI